MIKESVFRGSLDNKMAARKASIWALFTQCSQYEYFHSDNINGETKHTNDFLNAQYAFRIIYVDYTYLQFNGL